MGKREGIKVKTHGSSILCRRIACITGCILAAMAVVAPARGATVTNLNTGESINLATIISQGLSVQIGDKLFADFQFSYSDNNGNTFDDVKLQQINLTALDNSFGFGIRISNAWKASGVTIEDTIFAYSVTVTDPSFAISDAHMTYNGVSGLGAFSIVTEQFFTGGFGGTVVGQMEVHNDGGSDVKLQDTIIFGQTFTKLWVEKDIHLEGPGDGYNGGFATISIIDQSFSQVPEPTTAMLTLGSIGALWVLRKRKAS